ncbi:MAG: hypothetical protein JNL70_21400 [Saprospiraceae bacterium]|nr:hypothetical protein [Saprospiraceae bacterium]
MRLLILFFTLLCPFWTFCQDAYFKSTIVTQSNDTIKGLVSNNYDSKTFKFKRTANTKPVNYNPKQLKSVTLENNIFESKVVRAFHYIKKINNYGANGIPSDYLEKDTLRPQFIDTVFVQKIVNGVANLYKFTNKDGFVYYFVEKDKIIHELPPRNCYVQIDSNSIRQMLNKRMANLNTADSYTVYTYIKDDYLDTLGFVFRDKNYLTKPAKEFKYTEKSLSNYVAQYNKKQGVPNGGILKTSVNRKIFTGLSVGLIYLNYDKDIEKADLYGSYAFKFFGLYPLRGVNRNLFAKFGINYFTYRNESLKKSIPSGSFGLRYASVEGSVRPYIEASIGVASFNKNNRPIDVGFPMLIEAGLNIPIRNSFLTISATQTPVMVYKLNGYKLWSFNIGVLF